MTYEDVIKDFRENIEMIDFEMGRFMEAMKPGIREAQERFKIAVEALEKQIKYRWHDLRKNPTDLPEGDGYIIVMQYGFNAPCPCDIAWFYNSPNKQLMYAWKYIEPFEGVKGRDLWIE